MSQKMYSNQKDRYNFIRYMCSYSFYVALFSILAKFREGKEARVTNVVLNIFFLQKNEKKYMINRCRFIIELRGNWLF